MPVIERLKEHGACLSIDTRNAATMRAALSAGASLVNDISALEHDSESITVASEAQVPVILMHKRGNPVDMQENPIYNNVVAEVYAYLDSRIKACETAGIERKTSLLIRVSDLAKRLSIIFYCTEI